MKTIELDARNWETPNDFHSALKAALGTPAWHGDIVGALLDSIFGGGMNALKPPYLIRIVNAAELAPETRNLINDFSSAIKETRVRRHTRTGKDVTVSLEIESGHTSCGTPL